MIDDIVINIMMVKGYLVDFKSWSNVDGVVTVAIDNKARQPSSISLKKSKMRVRNCTCKK